MNFLPHFDISLTNAFWFSLLFNITNFIVLKTFPSHYKKRVLSFPGFTNQYSQIIGSLNFILFQGLIILIFFTELQFNSLYFYIGLLIFSVAYLCYLTALINYASTDPEKPVTKGIFKYTRNPQQLMTLLMWIGIGFMCTSWLITAICLLQLITVYPTFKAQEQDCIKKYGNMYKDYMKHTSRYFGYKKVNN